MYREPAPSPGEAPPAELLYPAVDRERRRFTAVAAFQLVTLPVAVAALLSLFATPAVALFGLVGAAVLVALWWRGGDGTGVLLRVDGDELSVLVGRAKSPKARLRLGDLSDVTLDTRTIRPLMEGDSPIPGLRFVNSQALPEVDQKRIVLAAKSGEVPLTETYQANVEATEWFGRIRVFLRKHGWVPESEREE